MISDLFKNTKPSRQVLTLLLALVFFMLLSMLLTGALQVLGIDCLEVENQRNLQFVSQLMMFLCPALLCVLIFENDGISVLGLAVCKGRGWYFLIGILFFVLLFPLTDWLTLWNDSWHFGGSLKMVEESLRRAGEVSSETVKQFLMLPGEANLVLNLLILALTPAVCEEFFFRGSLQRLMLRWLNRPWAAIIITAVIFSLAHGELFAFVPRFFLGAFLGALYYYSGVIWVNVLVHFLNNSIVVVSYYLYQVGAISTEPEMLLHFPVWVVALTGLLSAILFFLLLRRKRKLS